MDDQSIIQDFRKCKKFFEDAYSQNVNQFVNDKTFSYGEQWTAEELASYHAEGEKVAYTQNVLDHILQQLEGEQKNMEPDIQVSAVNQQGEIDEKIVEHGLRHIAYGSTSQNCYEVAFKNILRGAWGVGLIELEYASEKTFDLEIKVNSCEEAETIILDVNAKDPTCIDGSFCAAVFLIDYQKFVDEYGEKKIPASNDILGDNGYLTTPDEKIAVAHFYRKHYKKKILYQFDNGRGYKVECFEDQVPQVFSMYEHQCMQKGIDPMIVPLHKMRSAKKQVPYIMKYVMTSDQVIEKPQLWPSKYMPYIRFPGTYAMVRGKRITQSYIYRAISAQKQYNYMLSEIMNGIAKSRQGLFSFDQNALDPESATGLKNPSVRRYSILVKNGMHPQYYPAEGIPQSHFELLKELEGQIYTLLGRNREAQGTMPQELSGKAISTTIMQANLGFVNAMNSLMMGMKSIGKVCLDLMPKIYDTQRKLMQLDPAGKIKSIIVNQAQDNGYVNVLHDIEYNLEVQPVASFQQQKQYILQVLQNLMATSTERSQAIAPLYVKLLDTPISSELADILEKLMSPQVKSLLDGKPLPPSPNANLPLMEMQNKITETNIKKDKLQADIQQNQVENEIKKDAQKIDIMQTQQKARSDAVREGTEILTATINNHQELADTGFYNQLKKEASKYNINN